MVQVLLVDLVLWPCFTGHYFITSVDSFSDHIIKCPVIRKKMHTFLIHKMTHENQYLYSLFYKKIIIFHVC